MTTTLGKCSEPVDNPGGWSSHPCGKRVTVIENDKGYCTRHSPAYKARKQRERHQRYEAERAASKAIADAAAEQRRRAACYPELLAALEAAVSRITDDHECLDCGSQRPDGRGGTDHDQDCIVYLLEAAIAKASPQKETP